MTEPTTLGEALTKWESIGSVTFGQAGGSIEAFTKDFRRALYGTDEPCPVCHGSGHDRKAFCPAGAWDEEREDKSVPLRPSETACHPCPTCHGSGRIKTPGLVERFKQEVLGAAESDELPKSASAAYGIVLAAEALRREIGEVTP